VVARDRSRPILYPELKMLQVLHGDEAVTDVAVVGVCDMSNDEALMRLRIIYGDDRMKEVYPGARPTLDKGDPSLPICTRPIYVAPEPVPANPDPKLRPLDQYTMAGREVLVSEPIQQTEPTADEIAAHRQDDDDDELSDPGFDLPKQVVPDTAQHQTAQMLVQDNPSGRVGFRGQARQARRPQANIPDVVREPPKRGSGQHDHDRARG
jgi:hypothetical protein